MSRSELTRTAGAIAALIVSYAAAFRMLTLRSHDLSLLGRLGWICALLCPLGVGVFFWSRILAAVAKRRQWTQRNCQYMALLTMIPGSVLFFAAGANLRALNLVLYQAICTGLLVKKFVFPNADENGSFDSESQPTLLPK
jgi:hypothetical protein